MYTRFPTRRCSELLAPGRRRSMLREGGLVLALGVVELALFVSMGVMRPDMHHITGSPFLIWRVGSLGLLAAVACVLAIRSFRSEEHTSELQSLMRISYAVFCLKNKNNNINTHNHIN